MSQELITKIEEKLGGAIDLMTFDNAQQVVDYLSRYIQFKNLITTIIAGVICFICIVVALITYKRIEETEWYKTDGYTIAFIAVIFIGIISGIVFIFFLYDTIIAYNFPIAAIVEWLRYGGINVRR